MSVPVHPSARIVEFDGLRGLAISLVVWHHLAEPYLPSGRGSWLGWLQGASNLSWCGVDLFFVLSGFFIGGILLEHRDSARLAAVFYLRRSLRILPIFYLTLVAIFAYSAAGGPHSGHSFPIWAYPLFLSNFYQAIAQDWDWPALGVLWSICVEEQFYLVAPWVVRCLQPAAFPWLMAVLIVSALVLRLILAGVAPDNLIAMHVLTPLRMDAFALGAMVAWAQRTRATQAFWNHLGRTWPRWLCFVVTVLAVLTLLRPKQGSLLLAAGGYTLLACAFAILVAVIAGPRPAALSRLLAWPPLVALGRHSYFIYLWHFLLGLALIDWLGGSQYQLNSLGSLLILVAALGSIWALAALSWRFIESPLIRWSHRYTY